MTSTIPPLTSLDRLALAALVAIRRASSPTPLQLETWQRALQPGDNVALIRTDLPFLLYGELLAYSPGDRHYPPGVLLGRYFSLCTGPDDGDIGGQHVAYMFTRLTPEQFEAARRARWPATVPALWAAIAGIIPPPSARRAN